jgi:hypothetical protein
MAADAASTYEFKRADTMIKTGTLQPYEVTVVRFSVDGVTFTITATEDILVSYTRDAETSGGVRAAEGTGDSMAVPGTGTNVSFESKSLFWREFGLALFAFAPERSAACSVARLVSLLITFRRSCHAN